jgi:hypothetical protein
VAEWVQIETMALLFCIDLVHSFPKVFENKK